MMKSVEELDISSLLVQPTRQAGLQSCRAKI
jgi:hypothetical protein